MGILSKSITSWGSFKMFYFGQQVFQVVTREVASCGGDHGVKQMEAGGKK